VLPLSNDTAILDQKCMMITSILQMCLCPAAIKKQQLDEVRALARPPNPVRLTLEAVALLLGEKFNDWNDLRKLVRRDDFISMIINFEPERASLKQVGAVCYEAGWADSLTARLMKLKLSTTEGLLMHGMRFAGAGDH
jgi:hypothetical protein